MQLTVAIDLTAHILSVVFSYFHIFSYKHLDSASGFEFLSLYAYIKEILPLVVVTGFVFGLFEKILKERFVLNLTNEKSRKLLLGILDRQSACTLIVKENCEIMFYNQAFTNFTTKIIKMKAIPKNFLAFIEGQDEVIQEGQFQAFV